MSRTQQNPKSKDKDGELERREEEKGDEMKNETEQKQKWKKTEINKNDQNNKKQTKKQKSVLFRFPRVSWTGMPSLPGSGSKMDPKRLQVRGKEKELIPDGEEEEEWNEAEVHTWCGS